MNESQLQKKEYRLECGNSKDLLKKIESNSIDSIVTDPPYELGFMGKKWDNTGIAYDVELWAECLRVLKHGGHLLAFSGSRTYHRMAVAIEDAGFDIRDQIQWVYGSGFPKSHNISKAIDKMEGVESAKEWDGWGTALKPAHEPICVARKPLIGTVVENVLQYGTGGINVDGCRVGSEEIKTNGGDKFPAIYGKYKTAKESTHKGRWPANFIHDGSEEVLQGFPSDEKQSASRFFYCAKASKKDRDEGCEGFEEREARLTNWSGDGMPIRQDGTERKQPIARNHHPTVKPTNLMQYLCRLVTPPNGTILDPFLGSGSTGKAAIYERYNFIGFDLNSEYIDIAKARIEFAIKNKNNTLFDHE
jgi:DNA modification methylase